MNGKGVFRGSGSVQDAARLGGPGIRHRVASRHPVVLGIRNPIRTRNITTSTYSTDQFSGDDDTRSYLFMLTWHLNSSLAVSHTAYLSVVPFGKAQMLEWTKPVNDNISEIASQPSPNITMSPHGAHGPRRRTGSTASSMWLKSRVGCGRLLMGNLHVTFLLGQLQCRLLNLPHASHASFSPPVTATCMNTRSSTTSCLCFGTGNRTRFLLVAKAVDDMPCQFEWHVA